MSLQNDEHSRELLNAQAHIWNHIFRFINSMTLKCAIELQIPDIIDRHGAPMLLSELVEALSIKKERSRCVYRFMRILVHSGFFVKQSISTTKEDDIIEEESEGYLLTPAFRCFLLKDNRLSLTPFVLSFLDPIFMDPWQHMSKWFQSDDINAFRTTHGKEFWELMGQESKLNEIFNEAMTNDSRLIISVILKNYRETFQGLSSIVDVGGGSGTVAKAIAEAFPELNCICFDLPRVVDGFVGNKNLSYIGGDMFETIPKADAVLLKWVLLAYSDEECIKILKRCKQAISSKENGGKLMIIEMVVKNEEEGDDKSLETQLLFDVLQISLTTGRERSEKDWAKLLRDAGFNEYKIAPVLGLRSLIEAYP